MNTPYNIHRYNQVHKSESKLELTIEQAFQQAVNAHNGGKEQDAERLYRAILQSQPLHPDANHNLGVLAVSVDETDAALLLFKTALKANPEIEQFWFSYINALVKNNKLKDAKQAVKKAKKKGFNAKKLQALLPQKNEVAGTNKPSQELITSLFEHYKNGRFDDAEKMAISFTQQFPTHYFGWKILGVVFKETSEASKSLAANQKAVQFAPQDYEVHNNLGATLLELGRLDDAEASCKQAIALKPDFAEAHSNLAKAFQRLGRLAEAEESFKRAIELKPNYAEAHTNLASLLQKIGRLEEAEAVYTHAIALKPSCLQSIRSRWVLLFMQKKFAAALRDADSCIVKGYNEADLTTLYAMGRIEEIYKRIEIRSEEDGENISIAAFAAFIAEAEKKSTAYNFCPNPMDFIHVANLSSHLKDSATYVAGVIKELQEVETIWDPPGKTTKSGFQSLRGVNLFRDPRGKIAQLKSIISNELDAYYLKFQNEPYSYIKKWPSEHNLMGWHVILKQQGHQSPHYHPSGWLSGVIYLKVVPSLGKNEGAIKFSLNGPRYGEDSSPSVIFQPDLGDIVFFPSSLHHSTVPFMTETDRIIISFDLMPQSVNN